MTAVERVRAYVDSVEELYAEGDPMPEGLVIDTSGLWRLSPQQPADLTYPDLVQVLELAERAAPTCGQSAILSGSVDGSAYAGPCIRTGEHREHADVEGRTWTESVR